MKRIKNRSVFSLILGIACLLMLGILVFRFMVQGGKWASFSSENAKSYNISDRNGVFLGGKENGEAKYNLSKATRSATVHILGDFEGNIGTGALQTKTGDLYSYSLLWGSSTEPAELRLSVDAELCIAAKEAMGGQNGAFIMENYLTGEIIVMISGPVFDPAKEKDPNALLDGAYLNKCISATYTPGSVFKIVTLAAALENIDDIHERIFFCPGSIVVEGTEINCSGRHGQQSIEDAFKNSCNCAFAELSLELGADTLSEYAQALGISSALNHDGIIVKPGSFESHKDGSALLAWSGIGQAEDLVSPFAMMRLSAAIAKGGESISPTFLLSSGKNSKENILNSKTAVEISDMMRYNVESGYGDRLFPEGIELCAKTGTAELGNGSSHSWFTGFCRNEDMPYAFAVIIENGGSGLKNAGSVASAVLYAALEGSKNND